jgi:NAD(P) transhydrogenase subunit alpha
MSGVGGLYLILLAAVAGYVLIARVPSILHTPMMSGSNFIHGIVLAGAILALGNASGLVEIIIGFIAVTAAAANVVGGFVVTDRMLALFDHRTGRTGSRAPPALVGIENPSREERRSPALRSRQTPGSGAESPGKGVTDRHAGQWTHHRSGEKSAGERSGRESAQNSANESAPKPGDHE